MSLLLWLCAAVEKMDIPWIALSIPFDNHRNHNQNYLSQAVAKPVRQFGHAMLIKSLSLFISLEIDSFYSL